MDIGLHETVDEMRASLFNVCVARKWLIAERDASDGDRKVQLRDAMRYMDAAVKTLHSVFALVSDEQLRGRYRIGFDDADGDWVDGGNDEIGFDAEDYNDLAALWLEFCAENSFDPFSVQRVERVGESGRDDE